LEFLADDRAVYVAPGGAAAELTIPHRAVAEGRQAEPVAMTLIGDRGDTAVAVLRRGQCQVGAADAADWSIDVLTQQAGEAILLTGCCRLRRAE
jgi:hypothetical protein